MTDGPTVTLTGDAAANYLINHPRAVPDPTPVDPIVGYSIGGLPAPDEVRTVDPDTGGEKGSKLARFDLIPPRPLYKIAEVYGIGSRKYEDRNWEKGYAWGLSLAALHRHLNLWTQGERCAQDDGQHHLAAVAWHCLTLMEFEETHPEKDDVHPNGFK
jgi:hypothetical protein